MTLDRFFAIAGFLWKEVSHLLYCSGLIKIILDLESSLQNICAGDACNLHTHLLLNGRVTVEKFYHVHEISLRFIYQNRENSFVYNPVTNAYTLQEKGASVRVLNLIDTDLIRRLATAF